MKFSVEFEFTSVRPVFGQVELDQVEPLRHVTCTAPFREDSPLIAAALNYLERVLVTVAEKSVQL